MAVGRTWVERRCAVLLVEPWDVRPCAGAVEAQLSHVSGPHLESILSMPRSALYMKVKKRAEAMQTCFLCSSTLLCSLALLASLCRLGSLDG